MLTAVVKLEPKLEPSSEAATPYEAIGVRRTWTSDGGGCDAGGGVTRASEKIQLGEGGEKAAAGAPRAADGRITAGGAAGPPVEGGGDSAASAQAHLHSGPWALGADPAGNAAAPARSSSSPPGAAVPGTGPVAAGFVAVAGPGPQSESNRPSASAGNTTATPGVCAGPSSPPITPRAVMGLSKQGFGANEHHVPQMALPRPGSDGGAVGKAAPGLPLPMPSPGGPPYSSAWPMPYPGTYGPPYGGPYPVPVRYVGSPSRPVMWRRMQGRPPPPLPSPRMPPLPMPGQAGLPPPLLAPPPVGAAFAASPPPGGSFSGGQLPPPGMVASPMHLDAVHACGGSSSGPASAASPSSVGGASATGSRPCAQPYTWGGPHLATVSYSGCGAAAE